MVGVEKEAGVPEAVSNMDAVLHRTKSCILQQLEMTKNKGAKRAALKVQFTCAFPTLNGTHP
jgi:hypothetical protein